MTTSRWKGWGRSPPHVPIDGVGPLHGVVERCFNFFSATQNVSASKFKIMYVIPDKKFKTIAQQRISWPPMDVNYLVCCIVSKYNPWNLCSNSKPKKCISSTVWPKLLVQNLYCSFWTGASALQPSCLQWRLVFGPNTYSIYPTKIKIWMPKGGDLAIFFSH